MAGRILALFVGINDYLGDVPQLAGCVNDVAAMKALFTSMVGERLEARVITNGQATRAGVVEAFRDHLGQASDGDFAIFYFSGHGSYQPAPPELWGIEPDRRNETLVCTDSRLPDQWDLADKEISVLVGEVSQGGADVLIILDCCHSGSGVRGLEDIDGGQRIRQAPVDTRPRELSDFITGVAELIPQGPGVAVTRALLGGANGPRYVLLAACESSQTAKEQLIDGERRGVFSFCLETALRGCGGQISYSDLMSLAVTRVKGLAVAQTPQLEVTKDEDRTPDDRSLLDKCRTRARVTTVQPDRSLVALEGDPLAEDDTYFAVPISWPVVPMSVLITGDEMGVSLLEPRVAATSDLVVVADGSELVVRATPDGYGIHRSSDNRLVTTEREGLTPETADAVVRLLLHIATWRRMRDLSNPATRMSAEDVVVEMVPIDGDGQDGSDLHLYQHADGSTQQT